MGQICGRTTICVQALSNAYKEIVEERKYHHREAMKRVAAYIAKMMPKWEDVAGCIFASYNIRYV